MPIGQFRNPCDVFNLHTRCKIKHDANCDDLYFWQRELNAVQLSKTNKKEKDKDKDKDKNKDKSMMVDEERNQEIATSSGHR